MCIHYRSIFGQESLVLLFQLFRKADERGGENTKFNWGYREEKPV